MIEEPSFREEKRTSVLPPDLTILKDNQEYHSSVVGLPSACKSGIRKGVASHRNYFDIRPTRKVELSNEGSEHPRRQRLRDLKHYSKCIILPDDPWKKKWDILILL